MSYKINNFNDEYIRIEQKRLKYYFSTLLSKFNFTHAFFTKDCSIFSLEQLSKKFNTNKINYFNHQIHSNLIVNESELISNKRAFADGILSDISNINLWIYTADCMPIFFADKSSRLVSAIHCGRKGLEKNIIKKMLDKMEHFGSLKSNILVAIGPSISKANYLIDKNCLEIFYKNIFSNTNSDLNYISKYVSKISDDKYVLDIKGYALYQLISNKIIPKNIDISNNCTYRLDEEFYSWRREKVKRRNWNFITSK